MTKRYDTRAVEYFNHAIKLFDRDTQTAYRMLMAAIDLEPNFVEAWYAIGDVVASLQQRLAPIACYRKVVELDPNHLHGHIQLGHKLYHIGEVHEAITHCQRAIEIDPTAAFAWCNLSLCLSLLGDNKQALECAIKAHELCLSHEQVQNGQKVLVAKSIDDPLNMIQYRQVEGPDASTITQLTLAFALLYDKQYAKGLKEFECRFAYRYPRYNNYPYPRWDGASLNNKTILIEADQGIGDTISFARFVYPVVRMAKSVILVVQPEVMRLMPYLFQKHPNIQYMPTPNTFPVADVWSPIMSLPTAMNYTDEQIVNAKMPSDKWKQYFKQTNAEWKVKGKKLHVGIAWKGNSENDIERWRQTNVEQFLTLADVPGVQLYSLQIGKSSDELHHTGCSAIIKDMSASIRDVTDTLAIIDCLDLVITVESAIGHMAGLMDKECWVFYAFNGGDWRIGRDETSAIWYPKHKIFKQAEDAQWMPVFNRMREALKEKIDNVA